MFGQPWHRISRKTRWTVKKKQQLLWIIYYTKVKYCMYGICVLYVINFWTFYPLSFQKNLFWCIWVFCLYVCLGTTWCSAVKARGVPWNWSYRGVVRYWMWVLESEFMFSARALPQSHVFSPWSYIYFKKQPLLSVSQKVFSSLGESQGSCSFLHVLWQFQLSGMPVTWVFAGTQEPGERPELEEEGVSGRYKLGVFQANLLITHTFLTLPGFNLLYKAGNSSASCK